MLFLRFEDGIIATLNPRDWASASRCSMRFIDLTSPASPTSPQSTMLLFTGFSIVLDAIEEIIDAYKSKNLNDSENAYTVKTLKRLKVV